MDRTRISVEQVALLRWSEVALGAVLHATLHEVVSDISGAMVIFSKKFDLRGSQRFVVVTQNMCFQEFILFQLSLDHLCCERCHFKCETSKRSHLQSSRHNYLEYLRRPGMWWSHSHSPQLVDALPIFGRLSMFLEQRPIKIDCKTTKSYSS